MKGFDNVLITGATGGTNAGLINGTYQPTKEMKDNVTIYVKVDNDNVWLVYTASSSNWNVQDTAAKGTDTRWAHCSVRTKCLPHDCPVGEWIVDCEDAQPQPAVTVTVVPGVVKPQVVGGGGGDLSDLSPSPSHVAVGEATHRNGKGSS